MSNVTVYPNGDGTTNNWETNTGATINLYQTIDEGTTTPDDSDYILTSTPDDEIYILLDNMPSDFSEATDVNIIIRCRHTASGKGADPIDVSYVQLVQSDELTEITSTITVADATLANTFILNPGIIGGTSKTVWDGARLKIKCGSDVDGQVEVYAAQIDITYNASNTTYDETGSGGTTAGTATLLELRNNPSTNGGALGAGHAFTTEDIVASSNGVVIGGSFRPVYNDNGIGGATAGGNTTISADFSINGAGGTTAGGNDTEELIYNFISSGGATAGGISLISQDFVSIGGTTAGGDSENIRILTEVGKSNQATFTSGEAVADVTYETVISGGALVSGSAVAGISQVITGGVTCGGVAKPNIGVIASGGIIATGGESYLTLNGQGGVTINGMSTVQETINIQVYNALPGGGSVNTNRFLLAGDEVIPSVLTSGLACADVSLDDDNIVHWRVFYIGLSSAVTSIKFYGPAEIGETGSEIISLADYTTIIANSRSIGRASVLPSQIQDLLDGNWYLQINTVNNPGGEVRGQVVLSGTEAVVNLIPSTIEAVGGIVGGGESTDDVMGLANGGAIVGGTAEHQIHAVETTSGGVLVYGHIIYEMDTLFTYDETGLRGSVLGGSATILESYDIGGGVVSGSADVFAIYTDTDRLTLTGSQVIPPQTEVYIGSAILSLDPDNILRWDIAYNGPESSITNLRIRGPADEGETGPTVLELGPVSGLMMPNVGAYVLTTTLADSFREEQYYIEIYDDSNPVLRSQIWLNGTGGMVEGDSIDANSFISNGGNSAIGGEVFVYVDFIPPINGGATVSGTVVEEKISQLLIGRGGAAIGGTASASFVISPTSSGGGVVSGRGLVVTWVVAQGGTTVGGSATFLNSKNPSISGGTIVGGAIDQQNFYLSRLSFGGIRVGGRAKVVRVSEVEQVIQSIGRTIISDNLLKELELDLIRQSTKLVQIGDGPTPESEGETESEEWCDVETRCKQGSVPTVAQKRQTQLPPNKVTTR